LEIKADGIRAGLTFDRILQGNPVYRMFTLNDEAWQKGFEHVPWFCSHRSTGLWKQ
jgi:hypothetical protein